MPVGPKAVRRLEQKTRARAVHQALHEAADLLAPPERLIALAEAWRSHPAVRETLARNPSLPPIALASLLVEAPFAVAKNPVLILAPIEDPEFLHRPSTLALRRMLLDPQVPTALLEMLQYHPDESVAQAARGHIGLEGEMDDADVAPAIAARIAQLPVGDPALLGELLHFGIVGERARWSPLATLPEVASLSREARRERATTALARAVALDATLTRFLAIRSSWTDPAAASRGLDPDDRLAALLNPRATRRLLEPRAQDSHRLVRAAARKRLAAPEWRAH